MVSADTWWHLKAGEVMVRSHHVLHADPFSYTAAGRPWVAQEYSSEIVMDLVHRAFGFTGLTLLFTVIVTAAFWLVLRRCCHPNEPNPGPPHSPAFGEGGDRKPGSSGAPMGPVWLCAMAIALGMWTAQPTFFFRPQAFSLLGAALFLWLLDRYIQSRRRALLLAFPAITLIWVQLHAGYVLGLGLIAVTVAGLLLDCLLRARRWPETRVAIGGLVLAFLACLAVVPLNPNRTEMYRYPFQTLGSGAMRNLILEWKMPAWTAPQTLPFIILLLVTVLAVLLTSRKRQPADVFILLLFAAAAVDSRRYIPLFTLVAVPLITRYFAWGTSPAAEAQGPNHPNERIPRSSGTPPPPPAIAFVTSMALVIAAAACAASLYSAVKAQNDVEDDYPAEAVDFIEDHQLPPRLFNSYDFGGYLIYRLYPQYKVFIDGRADVYGDAFLRHYMEIEDGEIDARQELDARGVNTAIVPPSSQIAALFRMQKNLWRVEYEDDLAVVFTRKTPVAVPAGP
jgi:hypothetical protein